MRPHLLERVFPRSIDNVFRGHRFALWAFYPITLVTVARSLVHIFREDGGAQSIATIPLNTFDAGGADAVVSLFAFWGLSQLLLGAVFVVVGLRYRALIPFMYVLILAEYIGRIGVGSVKSLPTTGVPPGAYLNVILIVTSILGLVLSFWKSPEARALEEIAQR
jgi:hypothetical protein